MYKSRICMSCGDAFIPTSSTQRCCNKPIIRNCVICGKEYESKCNVKYIQCCSTECGHKLAHQKSIETALKSVKQCILCGREFHPVNNTQSVCDGEHTRICKICGNTFPIIWKRGMNLKDLPTTCSMECKTKASFAKGNPATNPEYMAKAKQTLMERYGVDHPMHSEEIKSRVVKTNRERYGADYFVQTDEYVQKSVATNQERYGTDWARQNPEIQKKSEDTIFAHYGVTNPMDIPGTVEKIRETYKKNTGYDYPMQNPTVKQKHKETLLSHYGVEYPTQNPEIKQKVADTMSERYGGTAALNSPILKAQIEATNLQRYGYTNPVKSPQVQAKIANTMMSRYGVKHYNESWDYRKSVMTDPSKADEWKTFLENPEQYINSHFDHKPNYRELENLLGVNSTSIWMHLTRIGKLDLIQYVLSYLENDIVDILHTINPSMKIVQHDRQLIKPYELDIYLPEYQIGIEINPTSTHNSSIGGFGNEAKAPSYHRMKTDLCENRGIFLFHIFGYEWHHKRDVIISMLRNLLGCNTKKIYARTCEIREVSGQDAFEFLCNNHRQNGVHSKVRYGLYYKGELVSLMTFGKMRKTIGTNDNGLSDCWELVRFCNKLNTSVVGGASKLFKHFIKAYKPNVV